MSNPKAISYKLKARSYLDYASTTPLDPRVKRAMKPFFSKEFGNPSSIHTEGLAAKKALDSARTTVARFLEAHADEIVFTSGGTEANNLALGGTIAALADVRRYDADKRGFDISVHLRSHPRSSASAKPHVVTTNIEHASVLEPLRALERQGRIEVTYVPVEPDGIVSPEKVMAAIRPNTVLVSVMYANNEIGTIQPIRKIGQGLQSIRNSKFILHNSPNEKRYPVFHCDACQAPLYLHCLVNALGVDLLSLDGHKIYGPKGVGALYVHRGTPLAPMFFGGGQERGLRSTTENVPGIVGLAEALCLAAAKRETESTRIRTLRDHLYFLIRANKKIEAGMVVNGSMEEKERLPNNLNISLPGIDTEFLTLQLDARGIAVSTKSSCLKEEKESYVVAALGPPSPERGRASAGQRGSKGRARSTLRFTLGRWTTKKEVEYTANVLRRVLGHV